MNLRNHAELLRMPADAPQAQAAASTDLSNLPRWNLTDLYPAPDSPELTRDLKISAEQAVAFET